MSEDVTYRRQPNILWKWVRRVLRMRVVLLSLVILPQILGMVAVAGIFCFQHVKETFIVPASSDGEVTQLSLRCLIRPDQVAKVSMSVPVYVDLLSEDDRSLASGEGMIRSIYIAGRQNVMVVQGAGLSAVFRQAKGTAFHRVRIRTRVRRVLDIVMAKGSLGQ